MVAGYGAHAGQVLLAQRDDSACGDVDTGKQVEDRCLSGSVGSDQTDNLVLIDFDVEVAHCGKSAENHPQVLAFKYVAHACTPFASVESDAASLPPFFFFLGDLMRLTILSMELPMEKSYVPMSPLGLKSIISTRASEYTTIL